MKPCRRALESLAGDRGGCSCWYASSLYADTSAGAMLEHSGSQRTEMVQVSLPLIPAALQTLLLPFILLDPVRQHLWECSSSAGEACSDAFAQEQPDLCSLPRETWHWTHRFAPKIYPCISRVLHEMLSHGLITLICIPSALSALTVATWKELGWNLATQ